MLDFSPDWDARYCYLLVLACAVISARVQVLGRLEVLKEKVIYAWGQRSTWIVFTVYLLLPLGLFWTLDRTGAIKDTSFFAAVFVGLAYPAILAGGTGIKPNVGIISAFDWLNRAVDVIVVNATKMVGIEGQVFERDVVRYLAATPAAQTKVEYLAAQYASSAAAFKAALSTATTVEEKAQVAFDYSTTSAVGLEPISELLAELRFKGVSPYTRARRYIAGYVVGALTIALVTLGLFFSDAGDRRFQIWRLAKTGTSDFDLHRAERAVSDLLNTDNAGPDVRSEVIRTLNRPSLDSKRSERLLQMVLASRGDPRAMRFRQIALELTDALRVDSVDVRGRVNHAILMLAEEFVAAQNPAPGSAGLAGDAETELKKLADWKPLSTESPLELERKVKERRDWWIKHARTGTS